MVSLILLNCHVKSLIALARRCTNGFSGVLLYEGDPHYMLLLSKYAVSAFIEIMGDPEKKKVRCIRDMLEIRHHLPVHS